MFAIFGSFCLATSGFDQPVLAALGLISFVSLRLFNIAALGLISQAASGLFSLTALGVNSFAIELGCPEEGFVGLVAQKKALLAWLPRKRFVSFVAQKRMLQHGCPEKDLKARLPRRGKNSFASPEEEKLHCQSYQEVEK